MVSVFISMLTVGTAHGQSRIDSLRLVLDSGSLADSTFITTSLELCKLLVGTDREHMIPAYANMAIRKDSTDRDFRSIAGLCNVSGTYYWQIGRLDEAAHAFENMRLIGITQKDSVILANSYNGLGTVYFLLGNQATAREYYQKGVRMTGQDSLLMYRVYMNLANTFSDAQTKDSAIPYYKRCIDYHQAHGNSRYLSVAYQNLAMSYEIVGNPAEALKSISHAETVAENAGDINQLTSVYLTMANMAEKNHPDMAIKAYQLALEAARKSQSWEQVQESLENLARMSSEAGNYRKAAGYLTELTAIDDTMDLRDRQFRMKQLEYEHDLTLQNLKKIREAQKIELDDLRLSQKRKTILIMVLIVFTLGMFLLIYGYVQNRKQLRLTRTKEKLLSILAHDIRSPFSGVLGLAEILEEETEAKGDADQLKATRSLRQALNRVFYLLENIHQWSQSESGKISFQPETQEILPLIEELIQLTQVAATGKEIRIENQVPAGLQAHFDTNMLATILRNLISNAIKFSKPGGSIVISAKPGPEGVTFCVKDQGRGLTQEQIDKLMNNKELVSTPGTRNESGSGLGLMIFRDFVSRHGGRFWIESQPGQGTSVYFLLPAPSGK